MKKFWSGNYLEFELPIEAINDCYHSGECFDNCREWQEKLKLNLDREKMIEELSPYGAWDNLNDMGNIELEIKLIWLASADILENYSEGGEDERS